MINSIKAGTLLLALSALSGCWNGGNDAINLGNVSIGQQMIDLKKALDQDAITRDEYDRLKETLLSIDTVCKNTKKKD